MPLPAVQGYARATGEHASAPTEGVEPVPSRAVLRDERGRFRRGSAKPARARPGAALGNVNATKPANVARVLLRRGLAAIRALVEAGKLPVEALSVLPFAAQYETEALFHLAGEASFVERRRIANAQTAAVVGSLCLAQAIREGVFVRDKLGASRLHPLIESALYCEDLEGRALDKLPRERRQKPVLGVRERAAMLQSGAERTAAPGATS